MATLLRKAVDFHEKEMASRGQVWWCTPVGPALKACLVYSELKVCHGLHREILSQKNLGMLSSCL